jgi:FdhE protein
MTIASLREEWADLLSRRPEFLGALAVYGDLLEDWGRWAPARLAPLAWAREACRGRWERGVPLLADAPPPIRADELEDLLASVMERVAAVREDSAPALRQLAEAWDRGEIGPAAFFPAPGRIGSTAVEDASGLPREVVAFLAVGSLRPPLELYFEGCRAHLDSSVWTLGVCPFCGGPAGFSDVLEDGQRRLACHLCGGGWTFSRTRCPYCGNDRSQDLVRLEPENRDQGYVILGCLGCRAYLKELDRRVRWNAQSALVEDWGSPHLDLVATRAGYWRPVPTLIQLA